MFNCSQRLGKYNKKFCPNSLLNKSYKKIIRNKSYEKCISGTVSTMSSKNFCPNFPQNTPFCKISHTKKYITGTISEAS